MNGVKVTREIPMYGYQHIFKLYSWLLLTIFNVLCSERGWCCNAHNCLLLDVQIWYWGHHMSPAWMESKWLKKHMNGYQQCVQWYNWCMLITLYVLDSERGHCYNAQNYYAVPGSYLTLTPSFISGDEWSQSDWRSKHVYGYQQFVQWYSLSIMIIFSVLYSERGHCCNTHNCFAIAGSYLTVRPSFVTGDEWSKWLKKHNYWYKKFVKWYSWSILIVLYVLYSEKCIAAMPAFFCCWMFIFDTEAIIWHRLWKWSQSDRKSI
jgi:hypothetical protein